MFILGPLFTQLVDLQIYCSFGKNPSQAAVKV